MLFVIAILFITPIVGSEIISSDDGYLQDKLVRLNVKIRQLTKILRKECPNSSVVKVDQFGHGKARRIVQLQLVYRVKKESYNQLMNELIKCEKSKLATHNKSTKITHTTTTAQPATAPSPTTTTTTPQPTTTTSQPTATTPLPTTTPQPTTTLLPTTTTPQPITTTSQPSTQPTTPLPPAIHSICKSALNFTDSWRLDHIGSSIKENGSGWACDQDFFKTQKNHWFRFTGAAGTRLLNKCPMVFSCGTIAGLWSDKQPANDGKIGVINRFPVYASFLGYRLWGSMSLTCTQYGPYDVESINCGNGDVIYKHGTGPYGFMAYCGMKI